MRRCRACWLENIDDEDISSPSINIPDGLNRKTVARKVPIPNELALLLHTWMYTDNPLRNDQGQQWPEECFDEQPEDAYLFPGRNPDGTPMPNKAWVSCCAFSLSTKNQITSQICK